MSANNNKENDLNLYIYNYIKQHSKLPPHTKAEKSKYSYYCKKLKERGLIENPAYGVWVAKEVQKNVQITEGTTKRKRVRSHAYRFVVKVPFISNWDKLDQKYLTKRGLNPKKIPQGYSIKIKRHTVWIGKDSVYVIFYKGKSFRVKSAKEGDACALVELNATLRALERKIKANLKFGKSWQCRCTSKHHAEIRNEIAQYYQSRGIPKWEVRDHNGTLWLLIDNSFNLHEAETVNAPTATKDMDEVVAPLMNTLRENPHILDDLTNTLNYLVETQKQQIRIQNNSIESQKESSEQIKSIAYLLQEHIKRQH